MNEEPVRALGNITKVYLLDVPLESDYKNTLYFASKSAQQSYFQSCIVKSYTDFTYQRKDKIIRIPDIYDNIYHCNYVMFQNSNYSNKWFYCFIDKMEYINDGRTDITIETDVIQTWLFDYTVKPSFVEREHVDDDTIGKHTVPEGLELGEYIGNGSALVDGSFEDYVFVMNVSEWSSGNNPPLAVNMGGIWYAGGCYIFTSIQELINVVQLYGEGRSEAIHNVWIVPKKLFGNRDFSQLQYEGSNEPEIWNYTINMPTALDSYTPRNKKLLTYPYQYLIMSNNNGSSNVLQYELSSEDDHDIKIQYWGIPVIGGSIRAIPRNYKGSVLNSEESLSAGKFPTCSWSEDSFTNWLTQNAVNIGVGVASSGLSIVGGAGLILTGAGAGAGASMIAGGVLGVASSLGQIYQHSFVPNSVKGNINDGDVLTAIGANTFHYYRMCIKSEYAKIIDKYFDMFGYKVNMVKTPNKNHRARWWYTKTIDVNIDGAIPNDDMQIIKNAYNNGITFWKNASEIQNYNLSNSIVS